MIKAIRRWIRKKRIGFPPCEAWNLSYYVADYLYKRLKFLAEHNVGLPMGTTEREWNQILKDMALGFLAYKASIDFDTSRKDKSWIRNNYSEDVQRVFRAANNVGRIPFNQELINYHEQEQKLMEYTNRAVELFRQRFFDLWD